MKNSQWTKVINHGQPFKDASGEGFIFRGRRFYTIKFGPTITGPDYKEPEKEQQP